LLKELHKTGRRGPQVPVSGLEDRPVSEILPKEFLREEPLSMPELSEVEVVRHFVNLSNLNYGVDNGFYPLGSCTMKYNPKISEKLRRGSKTYTQLCLKQGSATIGTALYLAARSS